MHKGVLKFSPFFYKQEEDFPLCLAPQIQMGTRITYEKIFYPEPAPRGFPESLRDEISQKLDGNTSVKPPDYHRQGDHTLSRAVFHSSTNIKAL